MEKNYEAIVEAMVQAYEMAEGGMSGWTYAVEMNQNGDVWASGPFSQGSQSQSSWLGETIIIKHIGSWDVEVESAEVENHADLQEMRKEYEEIDNLDEIDMTFYEWLSEHHQDERISAGNDIFAENKSNEIANYYDIARDYLDEIIEQQKEQDEYNEQLEKDAEAEERFLEKQRLSQN